MTDLQKLEILVKALNNATPGTAEYEQIHAWMKELWERIHGASTK